MACCADLNKHTFINIQKIDRLSEVLNPAFKVLKVLLMLCEKNNSASIYVWKFQLKMESIFLVQIFQTMAMINPI
jgi:hypothetical protein